MADEITPNGQNAAQGEFGTSAEGKTVYRETGEPVEIAEVVSTEGGRMQVKLKSGETVDTETLSFGSEGESLIYDAIAAMQVSPRTATALVRAYSPASGVDAQTYAIAMPLAYEYGKINNRAGLKRLNLTNRQASTAFVLGQADAEAAAGKTTKTESEVNINENGQSVSLRDSGKRDGSADPEGQISSVESGTGKDQGRKGTGKYADPEIAPLVHEGREVTVASLGIAGGSNNHTVRLIEGKKETASMKAARAEAQKHGLNVRFFVGDNLTIIEKDGRTVSARGYIRGNQVLIRADHPSYTAEQLIRHEAGHYLIEQGTIDLDEVRAKLAEAVGEENLDTAAELYAEAYEGSGYSAEAIWEELVCDSLGDMNIFARVADIGAFMEQMQTETRAATKASMRSPTQTRGSPTNTKKSGKAKYSFAGVKSATSDKLKLATAEKMLADGVDSETVRQETGWFKSYDGKWRFEIVDPIGMINTDKLYESRFTTLGELIEHPDLFAAYLDLADVQVTFEDIGEGNGHYNRDFDTISLSYNYTKPFGAGGLLQTLTHEIQHAVQAREEFARGASPGKWAEKVNGEKLVEQASKKTRNIFEKAPDEFKQMVRKLNRAVLDYDDALVSQMLKEIADSQYADLYIEYEAARQAERNIREIVQRGDLSPIELYYRTAGEVEARDSANRLGLTAEKRKQKRPDIDRSDVVFAEDGAISFSQDDEAIFNPEGKSKMDILNEIFSSASDDGSFQSKYLYFGRFNSDFVKVLRDNNIEVKDLPIAMNYRDAYLSMQSRETGRYKAENINYHNLGVEGMMSAISELTNPSAIMKSTKEGKIELALSFKDYKGRTGLAIIVLNTSAQNANTFIEAHIVTSIYGRNNIEKYIQKAQSEGRLIDKKQEEISQGIIPVQYRSDINDKSSTDSIYKNSENVNSNSEKSFNAENLDSHYSRELDFIDYLDGEAEKDGHSPAKQRKTAAQRLDEQKLVDEMYYGQRIAKGKRKAQEQLREERQRGREALAKQRERAEAKLQKTREAYRVSRQKATEGRHKTEVRNKIKRVVNELNRLLLNPTKEQHVPIGLQSAVASALKVINMDTLEADRRVAAYDERIAKERDPLVREALTEKRDRIAGQGASLGAEHKKSFKQVLDE